VPPAQYVPASHAAHTTGEVGVDAAVCSVPAAHVPAGRQRLSFGSDVYVSAAQVAHCRFATALPSVVT